jgi:hypothetical protein
MHESSVITKLQSRESLAVTKGILVLLPGIVRGMGRKAEIEVLTRKVQAQNASGIPSALRYIDCTVIGGPADLPDGDYIARFAGFSAVITRQCGKWLSSGIAVADDEQAPNADTEAEVEQISPRRINEEESEVEPPALNTSPQCTARRSFLV